MTEQTPTPRFPSSVSEETLPGAACNTPRVNQPPVLISVDPLKAKKKTVKYEIHRRSLESLDKSDFPLRQRSDSQTSKEDGGALSSDDDSTIDRASNSEDGSSHGSSNASSGQLAFGRRRTLFDKVPLTFWVVLLMSVPIIFLLVYGVSRMVNINSQLSVLQDGQPVFFSTIECIHSITEERLYTTLLNSTLGRSTAMDFLAESRGEADEACFETLFGAVMKLGDVEKIHIVRTFNNQLASLRASADGDDLNIFEVFDAFEENILGLTAIIGLADRENLPFSSKQRILQLHYFTHFVVFFTAYITLDAIAANAFAPSFGNSTDFLLTKQYVRGRIDMFSYFLNQTAMHHGEQFSIDIYNELMNDSVVQLALSAKVTASGAGVVSDAINNFHELHNFFDELTDRYKEKITAAEEDYSALSQEKVKLVIAVVFSSVVIVLIVILQLRNHSFMNSNVEYAKQLNAAVQRFVPRNQLRAMGIVSITEVRAGDSVKIARSMLFSDIRRFTTISESMGPDELFLWLQAYFKRMTSVVEKHKGYVDNFVGDALFCVFSDSISATKCGVSMHLSVEQLNAELNAAGNEYMLDVGVGIHHGLVVCGVVGDDHRLTCTLIASDVNLASRLEGLTKAYGATIIISESAYDHLPPDHGFKIRELGFAQVQGSHAVTKIFEVFQNDPLELKKFKTETISKFSKAVELASSNPDAALPLLLELNNEAASRELKDLAVLCKIANCKKGTTGPDRYNKTGEKSATPYNLELPQLAQCVPFKLTHTGAEM